MQAGWTNFLLLRLPLFMVVLLVLVEGGAFLLRESPPLRHPLDSLVYSMKRDRPNSAFLLMGDSVTQDVAGAFRLGGDGDVANLTTNQASGILGVFFLLQRYLADNSAPQGLVLAATPEFLGFIPDGATADVYLTSVFQQPEEIALLSELGRVSETYQWRPAVLSFEKSIVDRVIGLALGEARPLSGQGVAIDPAIPVETDIGNAASADVIQARRLAVPGLGGNALTVLGRICDLVSENGIEFHILWAPMPESVASSWQAEGVFDRLEDAILNETSGACKDTTIGNFNTDTVFPDIAFRDPDHLRRPGWTNHYAGLLSQYFAEF